jgi:hypothetical protein
MPLCVYFQINSYFDPNAQVGNRKWQSRNVWYGMDPPLAAFAYPTVLVDVHQ